VCLHITLLCRQLSLAGLAGDSTATSNTPAPSSSGTLKDEPKTFVDFMRHLVSAYSSVVHHGSKRAFHALPRLLTAMIEFGTDVSRIEAAAAAARQPAGAAAEMLERLKLAVNQHSDSVRALCLLYPPPLASDASSHFRHPPAVPGLLLHLFYPHCTGFLLSGMSELGKFWELHHIHACR
jgi:hypothetical protein